MSVKTLFRIIIQIRFLPHLSIWSLNVSYGKCRRQITRPSNKFGNYMGSGYYVRNLCLRTQWCSFIPLYHFLHFYTSRTRSAFLYSFFFYAVVSSLENVNTIRRISQCAHCYVAPLKSLRSSWMEYLILEDWYFVLDLVFIHHLRTTNLHF